MLPIHIACVQGKAEIITELIEKYGVDKSVVDKVYNKVVIKTISNSTDYCRKDSPQSIMLQGEINLKLLKC